MMNTGIDTLRMVAPPAVERLRLKNQELPVDGVFSATYQRMLHLARVYPVDRLLAVFRANAGLPCGDVDPPGSWESWGDDAEEAWGEADYPGPERAQSANLLRGHYAGHFLSMLALAYSRTGEECFLRKTEYFVNELGIIQDKLASTGKYSHPGFLMAYGEWQFSRLESYAPYGEIWAPYYTAHKVMAGLLDAYEMAFSDRALEILLKMANWIHNRLERLEPEQLQSMWSIYIAGEFGGLNETLARLAHIAQEPKYLRTAQFFDQQNLLSAAGVRGKDVLTDMHANQHIPQLIGYVHEFELTGDEHYLAAAENIFHQVVPGRMFAHGGSGDEEIWGPPLTVAGEIGEGNSENCVVYNMVKLANVLFRHRQDARLMDYSERAVLNHMLGSRHNVDSSESPEVVYMFPVHAGALRSYGNVGTCCGGTALEAHLRYLDGAVYTSPGNVWLNHYWRATHDLGEGFVLDLDADYPFENVVRISVKDVGNTVTEERVTLHLRVPSWSSSAPVVRVNNDVVEAEHASDGYVSLSDSWRNGDVIELQFQPKLRVVPTVDDPTTQNLEIGPIVLMAQSESSTPLSLSTGTYRQVDGSLVGPLGETIDSGQLLKDLKVNGTVELLGQKWEPAFSGSDEAYHMYVQQVDSEIAFAGEGTGIPNRRIPSGGRIMDEIWHQGAFSSHHQFLDRVAEVVHNAAGEGVLAAAEVESVLIGSTEAHMEAGAERFVARIIHQVDAESIEWRQLSESDNPAIEWLVPDYETENDDILPPVDIEVAGKLSGSGWYTEKPLVTISAFHPGQGETPQSALEIQWRVGSGRWETYTGPSTITDEGAHLVEARARRGSETGSVSERIVRVDTQAPVTEPTIHTKGRSVEIEFSAYDDSSGVQRIQWQGRGSFWATYHGPFTRALTDEEQVLEFAATDNAGNREQRRQLVLPRVQA